MTNPATDHKIEGDGGDLDTRALDAWLGHHVSDYRGPLEVAANPIRPINSSLPSAIMSCGASLPDRSSRGLMP